jgi:regulator of sigma E protease
MELLAQIPLIGGTLGIAIPFLVVLTVVVFVHEFGHYWVGRMCGIHAEVFSVGFGRPLFQRVDRRGTVWQIALIPLGGYVKFSGDMDPASAGRVDDDNLTPEQRRGAFHSASLSSRTLTVMAGPVANFLLSILVFTAVIWWSGQLSDRPEIAEIGPDASADVGFMPGDRVISVAGEDVESFVDIITILSSAEEVLQPAQVERDGVETDIMVRFLPPPVVTGIRPGMPAARAGMVPGDVITALDGKPVSSARELREMTADLVPGAEVIVGVEREGEAREFRFVPELQLRSHPVTREETLVPTMGISLPLFSVIMPPREPVSLVNAVSSGGQATWMIISGSMIMMHDMIFAGADRSQLGGPIRIAKMSGEQAERGISSLIEWIAVLSTAIGLLNLFPIPILDGGHLMFYAVEALRGRPVGGAAMRVGTMIGLSLVLLLLVFATYNDLVWLL